MSGGLSPADLRSAYKLPAEGGEARETIAITIAFDNPNAEADLTKYREQYKLPECSHKNGCFKKINQKGEEGNYPEPNAEWALEASLDLDMASATCPKCHILLIEAENNSFSNMDLAVEEAAKPEFEVTDISDSWAGEERESETAEDHFFNHPGIPILFASGDHGYQMRYPAASPYVIAVGGTRLEKTETSRGWSEKAWKGAGSGCSKYEAKPAWQRDEGCSKRTVADVSAVADPETPASVYDTYENSGWLLVGGTSAATPIIAGVEALSSSTFRSAGPSAFLHVGQNGELFDPSEGENAACGTYLCQAEVGYDGPTGWGTPNGPLSLPVAVTEAASAASVSKATLHGSVDPKGIPTEYQFEYGETTSYGTKVPIPPKSVGSGSEYVEASQTIEGLKGQKPYHYRITATNSEGTFHGIDRTFGTTPPTVTTGSASEVHPYRAKLSATVNPEGLPTSYYFEYGPTTSYGSRVPLRPKEIGSGTTALEESATAEALSANTTYHYRIAAKNFAGITYGADKTFATSPPEWRAQQLPQPGESSEEREAFGISCARPTACIAVGSYWRLGTYHTLVTLAEAWNGETWSVLSTPNPSGLEEGWLHDRYAQLRGVSCAAESECIAVGSYKNTGEVVEPLSDRWNGSKWEELSTPKPSGATEVELKGVSCTSSTSCEAVGIYKSSSGTRVTLAEHWNGSKWEEQPTPNPSGAMESRLRGVSCASSSECAAVGSFKDGSGANHALAERWNGSKWEEQPTPNPGVPYEGVELDGVSCISATACAAVGSYTIRVGSHIVGVTLAERWNGSKWEEQPTPPTEEERELVGVSCTSATLCTAVGWEHKVVHLEGEGSQPLVERLNGATWSTLDPARLSVPSGWWYESSLNSISCAEAEACSGVGISASAPEGGFASDVAFSEQTLKSPGATTEAASNITRTEATLHGTVNPNGSETKYYFEYGANTSYGSSTPATEAGKGIKPVSESVNISGLSGGKTIHYRMVATSEAGTTYGSDQAFTTSPWVTKSSPNPTARAENGLTDVSCYTSSSCVAIGYDRYRERDFTEFWNGSTWKYSVHQPGPGEMRGVSCFPTLACRAVGVKDGKAVGWYTIQGEYGNAVAMPVPSGTTESALNSISCTASNACTAVGYYSIESGESFPLVERYNGSGWSVQSAPSPPEAKGYASTAMLAVSCASSTSCTTVGTVASQPVAERWNGSEWMLGSVPKPAGAGETTLESVSCPTTSTCMAVGHLREGGRDWSLAETLSSGTWSVTTAPSVTESPGGNDLYGVSCTSATNCTAVGRRVNKEETVGGVHIPQEGRTLAESWNGSAWSVQSTPNVEGQAFDVLDGVACTSSTFCTAVGLSNPKSTNGESSTFAAGWNGSAWSAKTTPNPAPTAESELRDVSCSSSSSCVAIGYDRYREAGFGEGWNGSEWKYPSKQPVGGEMTAISCYSASFCRASGTKEGVAAVYWLTSNGEYLSATKMPLPAGAVESALSGISCTASNACTAVGYYGVASGASLPLVERYEGSGWSVQSAPSPFGLEEGYASRAMLAVSCASSTSCTTVGTVGNELVSESWNGSEWTLGSVPNPGGSPSEVALESVSCPTTSTCMAVGHLREGGRDWSLAETLSSGTWSVTTAPSVTESPGGNDLYGVSCTSATNCTAVGRRVNKEEELPPLHIVKETRTLAESWNGSAWSVQSTPNVEGQAFDALEGVACTSSTFCTAVGISNPKALSGEPLKGESATLAEGSE